VVSAVLERQEQPLLCCRAGSQLKYFFATIKTFEVGGGDHMKHGDLQCKICKFHCCLIILL